MDVEEALCLYTDTLSLFLSRTRANTSSIAFDIPIFQIPSLIEVLLKLDADGAE